MTGIIDKQKYAMLLAETLPGIIETEEENERALEVVNRLMSKGEDYLSPEENSLLRLLVRLIEDFEEKAYPEVGSTAAAAPLDVLKSLMEEHELKQKDLMNIFGSSGTLSEVLSGKRAISKRQAKRLGERFHISAEIFI